MKRKIIAIFCTVLTLSWGTFAFADSDSSTLTNEPSLTQTSTTTDSTIEMGSDINSENSTESDTGIDLNSTIDESTTVDAQIDTGNNTVENSTMVDNYTTGDINGQIILEKVNGTNLNSNSQVGEKSRLTDDEINMNDFAVMDSSFNVNGSNDSDNDNFFILNSSDILNLNLNTGNNTFDRNTIINNITTGNINYATNEINLTNLNNPDLLLNLKVYSILGDLNGDIVLDESMLNEKADIHIMDDEQSTITGSTQTNIDHSSDYQMSTGENTFGQNSLVENISTGDASAGYFAKDISGTFQKVNFFIINVLGDWAGINNLSGFDNVAINTMQAPNNADATEGYNDSQTIINQSDILNVTANTGKNDLRQNTLVRSFQTGDINLMQNVINVRENLASLSNRFNLYVINIVGNWFGNVRKAQKQDNGCVDGSCDNSNNNDSGVTNNTEEINNADTKDPINQTYQVESAQAFADPIIKQTLNIVQAADVEIPNISAGPDISPLGYLLLLLPLTIIGPLVKATKKPLDK